MIEKAVYDLSPQVHVRHMVWGTEDLYIIYRDTDGQLKSPGLGLTKAEFENLGDLINDLKEDKS